MLEEDLYGSFGTSVPASSGRLCYVDEENPGFWRCWCTCPLRLGGVMWICREDLHPFDLGLRDQHSIEWIAVVHGKLSGK